MKLLNQSLKYLSVSILFILSLWAVIFYFNMLREIKESVDEGLENYKRQIIYNAKTDSTILTKKKFDEGLFTIFEISKSQAELTKDRYTDTLLYMQDADDEQPELEPVRMLTTAFKSNGQYYELSIINSMVEEGDLIEELLWEALWLYLILVLSIIVINNFVLQRLWKPFYNFLGQLKSYRLGTGKNLPDVKTQIREFRDLQSAVNALLQHTLETYELQNQFIGNASHELQTPLAIAINKLELLIERGELENTQAESIAEVMNIISRLVRLNKSLLLLTKIENRQFLNNQSVSLNETVRQTLSDLEEIAEFNDVRISLEETSNVTVEMDGTLASMVISNLVGNAIFHNIPDGTVKISISENTVRICNTGKGEPLDYIKIFTRFYKSESKQSGTGLGLAIVKAICGLYGFTVSYHFGDNFHCFELRFGEH
ncbi:MAG TPA: HAMP domain-containing sensor histidine kinase [Algoriphagus sp.]|nr:HAMP domain-containing sensor histidine kinase [Algoriphagus sp.]